LHSPLDPPKKLTAGVLERMRAAGQIRGWRDELYPLGPAFDAPPLLLIERAAAPYFGMRSYGVHVNGEKFSGCEVLLGA
jgi:hypothetical protein